MTTAWLPVYSLAETAFASVHVLKSAPAVPSTAPDLDGLCFGPSPAKTAPSSLSELPPRPRPQAAAILRAMETNFASSEPATKSVGRARPLSWHHSGRCRPGDASDRTAASSPARPQLLRSSSSPANLRGHRTPHQASLHHSWPEHVHAQCNPGDAQQIWFLRKVCFYQAHVLVLQHRVAAT
jgi:hypothetical protein